MSDSMNDAEGYAASLRQQAQWIDEAVNGTVPVYARVDLGDLDTDELRAAADFIERQGCSQPAPELRSCDNLRAEAFELSCADQYRLACFVAENVGYVLIPDPLHGGSGDEENDLLWRLRNPLWSHGRTGEPYLDKDATVSDLHAAAIEIERLRTTAMIAPEPFDVMATIDPDYADSFERTNPEPATTASAEPVAWHNVGLKELADKVATQPLDQNHDSWPTIVPLRLSETEKEQIVIALRAASPPTPADTVREALEKRKAEIKTATRDHGWTNTDTAWHRAFGELSGLNYALEELRIAAVPAPIEAGWPSREDIAREIYEVSTERKVRGVAWCDGEPFIKEQCFTFADAVLALFVARKERGGLANG